MLLALLAAPFVAALCTGFIAGKDGAAATRWSVFASLVIAGLGFAALGFQGAAPSEAIPWFRLWGTNATITWQLTADGLSTWLIHVVTILTPLALLASGQWLGERMKEFAIAVLVMEGAMIGCLLVTDLVLFYLFFEAMLLPMVVLVAAFGDKDRKGAALQFFLYTMFGSIFMLVAIWYLAVMVGSTQMSVVTAMVQEPDELMLSDGTRLLLFFAFVSAFAVKAPLMPFHSWQARVYASAPTGATALLAGAMAKIGVYGFLRIVLPTFPGEMAAFAPLLQGLALVGIIVGAFLALVQTDLKRLLAYSSLSHVSMVLLGVFALSQTAVQGAIVQMVAHGFSVAALFLLIGALEHRRGSRGIEDFGGVAGKAPGLAVLMVMAALFALAVPGSAGFVGEFLILTGTALSPAAGYGVAAVAGVSLIVGAGYLLTVIKKVLYGPGDSQLKGLSAAEVCAVVPLLAFSLILGWLPAPVQAPAAKTAETVVAAATPLIASDHDSEHKDDHGH